MLITVKPSETSYWNTNARTWLARTGNDWNAYLRFIRRGIHFWGVQFKDNPQKIVPFRE